MLFIMISLWQLISFLGSLIITTFATISLSAMLAKFLVNLKTIEVNKRYLVCGSHLIYYRQITQLKLNEKAGVLQIAYKSGKSIRKFKLERDLFPTNARKEHKIIANKQQKFDKVTQKIMQAAQAYSSQGVASTGLNLTKAPAEGAAGSLVGA